MAIRHGDDDAVVVLILSFLLACREFARLTTNSTIDTNTWPNQVLLLLRSQKNLVLASPRQ